MIASNDTGRTDNTQATPKLYSIWTTEEFMWYDLVY